MPVFFTFLNTRIFNGGDMQSSSCPGNHPSHLHAPGCYDYRSDVQKNLSFYGLTNFMLKWIWCGSEGSYDDFCLWDIKINAEYFFKMLIATV